MKKTRCLLVVVLLVIGALAWGAEMPTDAEALALWTSVRCCVPLDEITVEISEQEYCVQFDRVGASLVTQTFKLISRSAGKDGVVTFDLISTGPSHQYFYVVTVDTVRGIVSEIVSLANPEQDGPWSDFKFRTYTLSI